MAETIIVILIVTAAVLYIVWSLFHTAKGKCDCGCSNCPMNGNRGCNCSKRDSGCNSTTTDK